MIWFLLTDDFCMAALIWSLSKTLVGALTSHTKEGVIPSLTCHFSRKMVSFSAPFNPKGGNVLWQVFEMQSRKYFMWFHKENSKFRNHLRPPKIPVQFLSNEQLPSLHVRLSLNDLSPKLAWDLSPDLSHPQAVKAFKNVTLRPLIT